MNAKERYELIRPIVHDEKTVSQVHSETQVPVSTLYRYLARFRKSDEQVESLADKPYGVHNHPNWLTEEDKDKVVCYKRIHPHKSHRSIAKELTELGILEISARSVDRIVDQHRLPENFFLTNPLSWLVSLMQRKLSIY